jgi:2-C-methyl-D-erythritol 2,4-cyclodiphosphate synthase
MEEGMAEFDPRQLRIGLGVDVHELVGGRPLIIGGVDIPYFRGLLGHSDADVLAHAVADSVLSAARLGDIGKLFPDTDPAYAGADSMKLLAHVGQRVREEGFEVIDVDAVIIAQQPKLSPYRDQMRKNIAEALGISPDNVGVKATTSERLGFEGREEGITCQSVALLWRAPSL